MKKTFLLKAKEPDYKLFSDPPTHTQYSPVYCQARNLWSHEGVLLTTVCFKSMSHQTAGFGKTHDLEDRYSQATAKEPGLCRKWKDCDTFSSLTRWRMIVFFVFFRRSWKKDFSAVE